VWAFGNETTSSAQCRLWKSLAPNQIRKRFVLQETLPRRTPKIHMEAEEALGKLKRCPSLADLTAFLGTIVGLGMVTIICRRNPPAELSTCSHPIVFQIPNSKVPQGQTSALRLHRVLPLAVGQE
jgi:hypothetical protein